MSQSAWSCPRSQRQRLLVLGFRLMDSCRYAFKLHWPFGNDCDRASTVWPLMFSTPRDKDFGMANQARQCPANKGSGMACRRNVAVVQHRMAVATQAACAAGLCLCKEGY